jgi:predicted NUDIX family NTP pyrophosphohydrolase
MELDVYVTTVGQYVCAEDAHSRIAMTNGGLLLLTQDDGVWSIPIGEWRQGVDTVYWAEVTPGINN